MNKNPKIENEIKDLQVKVNPDNTLEASATINTAFLLDDVLGGKYSKEDLKEALPVADALPEQINFYCKVAQDAKNNDSGFNLQSINVMGVPVPESIVKSEDADIYTAEAIQLFLNEVSTETGVQFNDILLSEGKLELEGKAGQ
jgi:hypothetical protein